MVAEDGLGCPALHIACLHGQDRLAALLLERGAPVDQCARGKYTPLQIACVKGHCSLVELLLQRAGSDGHVEMQENNLFKGHAWCSALDIACVLGHATIAEMLLSHGATGQTSGVELHWAAKYNAATLSRSLISHGWAPSKHQTEDLSTPLHTAALYDATDCAAVLLDQGASVDALDCDNQTPLCIAAS